MSEISLRTSSVLYSLLGEFTVEFERICLFMREDINYWSHSSIGKHSMIVKTLTTGMGAKQLLVAFRSIAMNVRKLTREEKILISKIYKQIASLIEDRNNILHGTWFAPQPIGEHSEMKSISGMKIKHTAQGIEASYLDLSPELFRPLIEKCQQLHLILTVVGVALEQPNFTNYFVTLPDGSISVKSNDIT